MAYSGQAAFIPLGTQGLKTDESQGRLPAFCLIRAQNVTYDLGILEKESGSRRYNTTPLSSPIVGLTDFWPSEVAQRLIAVTKDGSVYRFIGRTKSELLAPAASTDPANLIITKPPVLVAGANELAGRNRKLFIFSGNVQVQVIDGDASVRRSMTAPALDWTKSFPFYGLVHRNRLFAFGNTNDPHRLYASDTADHENFQSNSFSASVYPGEGERLISAYVHKSRLFIFKHPSGAYYLDDTDANTANWGIRKLGAGFSAASFQSAFQAHDDLYVANSVGSLTSLKAVQAFGDFQSGDVMSLLRNETFMRDTVALEGEFSRQTIYYERKKRAYVSYRAKGSVKNDRLCEFDFNGSEIRTSWSDKDQPNCLALLKDVYRIPRPVYGANDGYVYELDSGTWDVGGSVAYRGEFQTPALDFSHMDPTISERMKLYDFLEVSFEEMGSWSLSVDVFIDGGFSETITFNQTKGQFLGNLFLGPTGNGKIINRRSQSLRLPLHGTGRRISFKCYNAGLRQRFRVTGLTVYFRLSGQAQKS